MSPASYEPWPCWVRTGLSVTLSVLAFAVMGVAFGCGDSDAPHKGALPPHVTRLGPSVFTVEKGFESEFTVEKGFESEAQELCDGSIDVRRDIATGGMIVECEFRENRFDNATEGEPDRGVE